MNIFQKVLYGLNILLTFIFISGMLLFFIFLMLIMSYVFSAVGFTFWWIELIEIWITIAYIILVVHIGLRIINKGIIVKDDLK